jgi:hypothetical protein
VEQTILSVQDKHPVCQVGTGTFAGPSPRSGDDIIRLFPFAADRKKQEARSKKMETESLGSAGLALFQTWGHGWVRRLVEKPQVWERHQPFATAHLSGAPLGLS